MSDCRHLTPKICGNKLKPFLSDRGCGVPRFVGIEDVTINQGIGIDLTEGVYAYDGNGNEIEYTVTPDSIDMCDVGEHTVIYRAMAEGKKFAPWFCSKQRGLAGDLLCNRIALRKDRTVTIEQIDPPRIEGLDTVRISPNVEFDPTEGVTAIDGNGNEIEYTYYGVSDVIAEGDIASFELESEQNAKSVLVNIEPVQNLNGYNNPWVGGSTKNKCSVSDVTFVKLQEVEIDEIPIGIYVFSAVVTSTDTDSSRCTVGFFDANKSLIKFEFIPRSTYGERVNTASFYASAPIKYIRFYASEDYGIGEGDTATYSDIQIERGSTVTPYIPYENICPISGHTSVVTSVVGKNLFDPNLMTDYFGANYIVDSDGSIEVLGADTRAWTALGEIPIKSGEYILSAIATSPCRVEYRLSGENYATHRYFTIGDTLMGSIPIHISEDGYYKVKLATLPQDGYPVKLKIQLELGSTVSDYEPYRDADYTTQLGQTVYGGTLDVVTGKLVVDRAMVTLDGSEAEWIAYTFGNGKFGASYGGIIGEVYYNNVSGMVSDKYNVVNRSAIENMDYGECALSNNKRVYFTVPNADIDTLNGFMAWLASNNVQLCYKLATPQAYFLTRREIALLEGQNNIWSDSGDVRVVYQESMPIGESIEYDTVGERIIRYTATDVCGNTSEVDRQILVGITAQACKSQACGAFVYCAPAEACEAIVGLSATACE